MYAALFLLYVVVEIAALVLVGHVIGVMWTVLLLLGGTLIGLLLMRSQWRRVIEGFRLAASGNGSPGAAVVDGALVALGSALMFVPGLVTSALGLLFLIPPTRWLLRPVVVLLAGRRAATVAAGAGSFARATRRGSGDVVEGEIVEEVFEGEVFEGEVLEVEVSDEEPRTPTRDRDGLP
ncbi:FxsA family protein [Rhodococcus marinonascens]|uniref:FxsA family protein n=1 Tax=Rhodococcus marinonascens TaxID=38311 RepID=UPI0009343D0E|nr:FxsA family protein [Rhodococcus marinonascens]